MKLEGMFGEEEMAGGMKLREGWLMVLPEFEGSNIRASEMLRWLIALHDTFELYGRPRQYSWDPRDPRSMMFAYPIGPQRDVRVRRLTGPHGLLTWSGRCYSWTVNWRRRLMYETSVHQLSAHNYRTYSPTGCVEHRNTVPSRINHLCCPRSRMPAQRISTLMARQTGKSLLDSPNHARSSRCNCLRLTFHLKSRRQSQKRGC